MVDADRDTRSSRDPSGLRFTVMGIAVGRRQGNSSRGRHAQQGRTEPVGEAVASNRVARGAFWTMLGAVVAGFVANFLSDSVGSSLQRFLLHFLPLLGLLIILALINSYHRSAHRLRLLYAFLAIALVVTWTVSWVQGDDLRRVENVISNTCLDPMWSTGSVTCYEEAAAKIVKQFEAFEPSTWHDWAELSDATPLPIYRFPSVAPVVQGAPVSSVGTVASIQDLGGVYSVQLKAPLVDPALDSTGRRLFQDAWPTVMKGGQADVTDSTVAAYCLLVPRPFFDPNVGDVMAFNGVVVAVGRIAEVRQDRTTGFEFTATYVLCSSAEILRAD